jgi:hypothetical protein
MGQYNLATLLESNPAAMDEALAWYRRAAEQKLAAAQSRLGWLLLERGQDAEAVQWLTRAAEQNDAQAQNNLGVMYETGRAVEKNPATAATWYRRAAQAGDAAAQNNLGAMLRDGLGVPQNYAEAAEWFKRAADQGYAKAMLNLGSLYELQAKAGTGQKRAVSSPSMPSASAPTAIPLPARAAPVGKPLQ